MTPALPAELVKAIPVARDGGVDWWQVLENWGVALAILLIGIWLAKWVSRVIGRLNARAKMDSTLNGFLCNVAYALMLAVIFIAVLDEIGVPINSALAILGTAGLTIGLALKDSLSNIASGVMLVALRPFRGGDTIQAAGHEGMVEEVRIFQTRLRTADNRLIILPNSSITTAPIINFTAKPRRRIDITVGIGYNDDLKRAHEILLALADENPLVLKDPAPLVQVASLGESSVNLVLYAWAKTSDFGNVKSELIAAVRNQIMGNGMSIPYPQRDLHVYHHSADGGSVTEQMKKAVTDDGDTPPPSPPVVSGN